MMFKDGDYLLPFFINATDLAAGTTQWLSSPCDGFIREIETVVQVAISTGGTIKVQVGSTDVAGAGAGSLMLITHANADAAGVVDNAESTFGHASTVVTKSAAIEVIPSAAYTGGAAAVRGWIRISGGK
jgi:hypothetical protein